MKPSAPDRVFRRVSAVCLLLINLCYVPAWAQDQAALRIVIVEGEGAINNIKDRVNREPIIQVEDENHKPIAGAAVVFALPNQGPGGVFANGTRTLTVTTNAQGRAVAAGIRRNDLNGQMQIRVTASFAGQTATAVITQNNMAAASVPSTGLGTTAKVLLILGIAGGAAAGAVVATRGGSSSSSTTTPPPPAITITAGAPTVGTP